MGIVPRIGVRLIVRGCSTDQLLAIPTSHNRPTPRRKFATADSPGRKFWSRPLGNWLIGFELPATQPESVRELAHLLDLFAGQVVSAICGLA